MSNFLVNGVDLDLIFAPLAGYTPIAASSGYQINGVDLNQRYLPIAAGVAAPITNFKKNGSDLNTVFAFYSSYYTELATSVNFSLDMGYNFLIVCLVGGGGGGAKSPIGGPDVPGGAGGNSTITIPSIGFSMTANGGGGGGIGVRGTGGGFSASINGTIINQPNISYGTAGVILSQTVGLIYVHGTTGGIGGGGGGGAGGYDSFGGNGALYPNSGGSSLTGGGGGTANEVNNGADGGSIYLRGYATPTTQLGGYSGGPQDGQNTPVNGGVISGGGGGGSVTEGGGGGSGFIWARIPVTYNTSVFLTIGAGGTSSQIGGTGKSGRSSFSTGPTFFNFPTVV